MPPNIKMTLLMDGEPVKKAVFLTVEGLRRVLVQVCHSDEAKVNGICQALEQSGRCRLGEGQGSLVFEIEKVLAS